MLKLEGLNSNTQNTNNMLQSHFYVKMAQMLFSVSQILRFPAFLRFMLYTFETSAWKLAMDIFSFFRLRQ